MPHIKKCVVVSLLAVLLLIFVTVRLSCELEDTYSQITPVKISGPEVIIEAPDSIRVGGLITVEVGKSIGSGFDFKVIPEPDEIRIDSSGKILYCGTGNKHEEYLFIVSCALEGKSDIGIHTVKILGRTNVSTSLTISEKVVEWSLKINSPSKQADANKLGQSFSSIAVLIENGTLTDPQKIIEATAKSNVDALGNRLDDWKPFLDAVADELDRLSNSGKLTTPSQHARVWRDVAKALKTLG